MVEIEVFRYEDESLNAFVPWQRASELRKLHIFATWIFGVRDSVAAAQDPSFDLGARLEILREPENPWNDPNALGVWNANRSLRVGYVPSYLTSGLVRSKHPRVGMSLYERIEEGKRIGLGMLISREPIAFRPVDHLPAAASSLLAELPMERTE